MFLGCSSGNTQLTQVSAAVSAAGSEVLVHQPQHRDREERPVADGGGPGGLPVRNVAAGSSDRSPQLLQERLQVRNTSLTQR